MVKISNVFDKIKKDEENKTPPSGQKNTFQSSVAQATKGKTLYFSHPQKEPHPLKGYFSNVLKLKAKEMEKTNQALPETETCYSMEKEDRICPVEELERLYEDILFIIKELLKEDTDYTSLETRTIMEKIGNIVDQLTIGNDDLLALALTKDSVDINYLLCHSVNTCIYSIDIGLGLGYNRSQLIELGASAFLHDIGMKQYLGLVNRNAVLTPEERNEIKEHTAIGRQILENINGLSESVINTVVYHHERIDGSGYPKGLQGESISEYAKIVGLVDMYTAMVHPRIYRHAYLATETAKEIMRNKNAFVYSLLRVLIERIGIFPPGSMVQLNTKETARVIKRNHKFSMSPLVQVISDADGKPLKENKVLNLADDLGIHIKGRLPIKT
ncbi:MAG: HD domain-containing protein [Candidatus Omnitrophica bacterium]|nr:HD domain-containing protein [Candidatus Omnitrophota bacterium]